MQVERELDREEESLHILVVKASERCDATPDDMDFFDPNDDTLLKVVVNVDDVNDNRPVFAKDVFTGGLTTEADFGAEILCVSADDADAERNSLLRYHLRHPIQSALTDGMDHVGSSPFVIDTHTGCLSLNFDPQRNMKGYFDMEVIRKIPNFFFSIN